MNTALDVAKYIINKCTEDDKPISNLQLQKILYFIQRDSFKKNNKPLISDDFEAWPYGPVNPSVYRQFCGFGGVKISYTFNNLNPFLPDVQNEIDLALSKYRDIDAFALVKESHVKGGAWDITYDNGKGAYKTIEKLLIKKCGK